MTDKKVLVYLKKYSTNDRWHANRFQPFAAEGAESWQVL
jgi:hypothetical protein